jgi:hypothetical protein
MLTAAAVTAALLAGAAPAHAATNAVHISGSYSMDPGVPCPVTGCDEHWDFTAAWVGLDFAGTSSCTYDGHTGPSTLTSGNGSGTMSCSGGVSASGTVSYTSVGPQFTMVGSVTVNGRGCSLSVSGTKVGSSVHGSGTVTC